MARVHLALAVHAPWLAQAVPAVAPSAHPPLGVGALELNLAPSFDHAEMRHWLAFIAHANGAFLWHLHAPLAPDAAGWQAVAALAAALPVGDSPSFVVVRAPNVATSQIDPTATVAWLRQLRQMLPQSVQLAVELGWHAAPAQTLRRRWQRWRQQAAQRARFAGRPQGVGRGLGAVVTAAPRVPAADALDPPWAAGTTRGWNVAGTRQAVVAVVAAVDMPGVSVAWDMAHDWLGGLWSGTADWTTVPPAAFLERVGYVRLHDVADDGTAHLPLLVGNVPYTTQLRMLLRTNFTGPVALAMQYSAQAARYGSRQETQARSLAVARRVLRLTN